MHRTGIATSHRIESEREFIVYIRRYKTFNTTIAHEIDTENSMNHANFIVMNFLNRRRFVSLNFIMRI